MSDPRFEAFKALLLTYAKAVEAMEQAHGVGTQLLWEAAAHDEATARLALYDAFTEALSAPVESAGPVCECGHTHRAGTDGEDEGCRDTECDCFRWRPPVDLAVEVAKLDAANARLRIELEKLRAPVESATALGAIPRSLRNLTAIAEAWPSLAPVVRQRLQDECELMASRLEDLLGPASPPSPSPSEAHAMTADERAAYREVKARLFTRRACGDGCPGCGTCRSDDASPSEERT